MHLECHRVADELEVDGPDFSQIFWSDDCSAPVLSSIEQPHAGTLSQAGPHDNNKDQFESGSKMQKLVLSMP